MNPRDASVVIVGAGPAGLAAAASLAAHGVRGVLVVDRDDAAGGLPRFCHHPGFGWEFTRRLESGPRFARRLVAALDPAAVTVATRTSALSIAAGPELELVGPACGHVRLRPRVLILATGVRERPRSARMVPGRRPERGILTTGQLQQMVARGVAVQGRRAVVVGTEHVAFSVLLTARRAGLQIVAMAGGEDRVMSYAGAGWIARALGVPVHLSSVVEDIDGDERVEAVVLRGAVGTHRVACDTVVFTGEFVPDAAVLLGSDIETDAATAGPVVDQFGRTTARGVFAAGNLLRAVESSGRAAIEGARVGANAAAHLRGELDWPIEAAALRIAPQLAYLMPQRWAVGGDRCPAAQGLPISLRSRVDIPRARLRLDQAGELRWTGRPVSILRQRRVSFPAAAFDRLRGCQAAEVAFDAT